MARKALTEGLLPRSWRGADVGNWEHTVQGHPECVYLTDIYAPYFAGQATDADTGDRWAIVEVDTHLLDYDLFRPDEDCLEQGTRHIAPEKRFDRGKLDMKGRTEFFRDKQDEYADAWERSLEYLGTCAYKGRIQAGAISRVALYDWKSCPPVTLGAMDAMIILANHRYCYGRHKAVTDIIFGEKVDAATFFGIPEEFIPPGQTKLLKQQIKKVKVEILTPGRVKKTLDKQAFI